MAYSKYLVLLNRAKAQDVAEPTFHIELKNLWGYRTDPSKKGLFFYLARNFFPSLYGKKQFFREVDEKPISEFYHVSTEALVILHLENNYDYWIELASKR